VSAAAGAGAGANSMSAKGGPPGSSSTSASEGGVSEAVVSVALEVVESTMGRARATGGCGVGEAGICVSIMIWGDLLGVIDVGEGDGVPQQRGNIRRLDYSSSSRSNWTSHCPFLVRLAGGEHGGGDSAGCSSAG
jgi:hypothetical protein